MDTRRKFILDCSALAVSASILPKSLQAATRLVPRALPSANATPPVLSLSTFSGHVGKPFVVRRPDGSPETIELIEASQLSPLGGLAVTGDSAIEDSFSLLFLGAASSAFVQDTYLVERPGIGRFEMFLTPIGLPDGRQCYYEAVFNRAVPKPSLATVACGAASGDIKTGRLQADISREET